MSKILALLEPWRKPLALWLAIFLVSFNIYVMTAVVVPVVRSLGTAVGNVRIAIVLLSLVMALGTPSCENLSAFYGRKRVFLSGLIIFAVGVTVTAMSSNIAILILGYSIIAGLGSTPLVSVPWSLIGDGGGVWSQKWAVFALSLAAVSGGLIGPLLGGLIATESSWRWAFGPQVGVALAIYFLARAFPESIRQPERSIDWIGGGLSLIGLGSIMLGISTAAEYGWWTPKEVVTIFGLAIPPFTLSITPTLIIMGVTFLSVFTFYWRRRESTQIKSQVWRFGLFRERPFMLILIISGLFTMAIAGVTFNFYNFLPLIFDLDAFKTAMAILPYFAANSVVLVLAFRLGYRLIPKYLIQIGLILVGVGIWLLYYQIGFAFGVTQLFPGLLVMGAGAGLFLSQIANLSLAVAAAAERSESNGIYNTFQDLGNSLGVAVLGALFIGLAISGVVDGVVERGVVVLDADERQAIIFELEEMVQTFSPQELSAEVATWSEPVQQALKRVVPIAVIHSMRTTLLFTLALIVVAMGISWFLPQTTITALIEDD